MLSLKADLRVKGLNLYLHCALRHVADMSMQIQRLVCQQAGQIGQWFGNNHKLELAFAAYYNRGCGFTSLSKLRTCSGLNGCNAV